MQRVILLPVKDLRHAKRRLAPLLADGERAGLVAAMMEDVFRAVAAVRAADAVCVVSSFEPALEIARALGWLALREEAQESESASVDMALAALAGRGAELVLRLPIDVPLARPGDIEELLAAAEAAPSCLLVPSRDGSGTNALLRTPPALFPSRFGADSLRLHLEEAARCGARARVLRNARLELDVDDAGDLRLLAGRGASGATARWLALHGFAPGAAPLRDREGVK
jgi:2-phospho-L-lactate guanylyltransferase